MIGSTDTVTYNVPVDEGSPWSVHVTAHARTAGIHVAIYMSEARRASFSLEAGLCTPEWEKHIGQAADQCILLLEERQVHIPEIFRSTLCTALYESRIASILFIIRKQASSLIQYVSSSDACRVWSEMEALHVLSM